MSSTGPTLASMAIMSLFLVMLLGQVFKHFSHWSGIPFTPMILILGLIIGLIHEHIGQFGEGVNSWNTIHPKTFLFIFMPPLIFESAFNSDWHTFKREIWQVIILAGPSLLISMFLTGAFFYYVLDYQSEITLTAAFMFGAIISATDPVAVVALLKELGASKRFATLIEGESLLNDGTALVMFDITLELVLGESFNFGNVMISFVRLSFGGVLLGLIFGFIVNFLIKRILNNLVLEFNLTLVSAYLIFYLAEDSPLKVSGILSLVFLGLYMTMTGRMGISIEAEQGVHHIWSYLGFLAETTIFTAAGVFIGTKLLSSNIFWQDYLKLIGLWVGLQVIRFIAILAMFLVLRKLGYGLSFKQLIVLTYGGLRGAVGLLLALVVDLEHSIDQRTRDLVVFHVGGIAFLTLIINGTTIRFLIDKLGLSRVSKVQQRIMSVVLKMLERKGFKEARSLKKQKHFNLFDWDMIKKRIAVEKFYPPLIKKKFLQKPKANFKLYVRSKTQINEQEEEAIFIDKQDYTKDQLQIEARIRFLKMLKGKYWNKFESGFCSSAAALRLLESADRALDHSNTEIQDWQHLKSIVKSHSKHKCKKCTSCLFRSKCCGPILKHFFIHRVSLSYDICVNFIESHQYVRRVQEEIVYDQDIRKRVEQESLEQTQKAELYLHQNFDGFYPSLAKLVQNKRAIYYALRQMNAFVHQLKGLGKINSRETKALLALNEHRIHSEMLHPPQTDLTEDRGLALRSELKELLEQDMLHELIYSQSSVINRNSGEIIYKQGEYSPSSIYFITRGGVIEQRDEITQNKICHKIGQTFGFGNIIISECVSTAQAITFTELLEIPIENLKSSIDNEKRPLLWSLLTIHLILAAPDLFGPFKKFDRGEISQILKRSQLVFYKEGEMIDLYNGALFIEGEAIGKRVEVPRPFPLLVREESEENVTQVDQELKPGALNADDSFSSDVGALSRMEMRLNELQKKNKQLEVNAGNYLHPNYVHQNTNLFYKSLRFIYPMDGILAKATQNCTLYLLPADLRDTWLTHGKVIQTMGLKSGLGTATISRENHHTIHRVGLPLQLIPGHKRISEIQKLEYQKEVKTQKPRRKSLLPIQIQIPEIDHQILKRNNSIDPSEISSEGKINI